MDKVPTHAELVKNAYEITQSTVYLMGISFILGSLFTLFLLMTLDFVRRGKERDY